MKTLHLVLKKKWFDLIASGEKTEEYREIKPHWDSRLKTKDGQFKHYDRIIFRLGYSSDAPKMIAIFKGIRIGVPNPNWCELEGVGKECYVIDLKVISND